MPRFVQSLIREFGLDILRAQQGGESCEFGYLEDGPVRWRVDVTRG